MQRFEILADAFHALVTLVHGSEQARLGRGHSKHHHAVGRTGICRRRRSRVVSHVGLGVVGLAGVGTSAGGKCNRRQRNQRNTHTHSSSSAGTTQLSSIILMIPEKSFEPPPRSTNRWKSSSASPPIGA